MKKMWRLLSVGAVILSSCSSKSDSVAMTDLENSSPNSFRSQGSVLVGGVIGAVSEGLASSGLDDQDRQIMQDMLPNTLKKIERGQRLSLNDIKAMSQAGLADPVITSQISATSSSFHLTTSDIIDLKNSGVSQRVIDVMIQTGG